MKLRAKAANASNRVFLSVAGTTKPAAGRSHGTTTAVDATILEEHPEKRALEDALIDLRMLAATSNDCFATCHRT